MEEVWQLVGFFTVFPYPIYLVFTWTPPLPPSWCLFFSPLVFSSYFISFPNSLVIFNPIFFSWLRLWWTRCWDWSLGESQCIVHWPVLQSAKGVWLKPVLRDSMIPSRQRVFHPAFLATHFFYKDQRILQTTLSPVSNQDRSTFSKQIIS